MSAQAVSLPDAWRTRGLGQMAMATYRIELPLPDGVPARMQALRFTHISARVVMYLNGHLLYERGAALANAHAIRTLPLLVEAPPTLLVPGRNLLELRVQHGNWQRAGLAGVGFGDHDLLAQAHQRHQLWRIDVLRVVNLLAMAVSAVLLAIWWLRRSEVALGQFGALFLITSFRNVAYFAELLIPAALADWMQFGGVLLRQPAAVAVCLAPWRQAAPAAGAATAVGRGPARVKRVVTSLMHPAAV